jgi:large subunit ribosomal protein L31e
MTDEKIFTIPLRKEFLKVPMYKRSKKATTAIKQYLMKHMKSNDVRIEIDLNNEIWAKGNRSPPPRIKVKAMKDDKGLVRAQLIDFEFDIPKDTKKEKKKETKEEKKEEKTDLSLDKNIKKVAKEQTQIKKDSEEKSEEKPEENK